MTTKQWLMGLGLVLAIVGAVYYFTPGENEQAALLARPKGGTTISGSGATVTPAANTPLQITAGGNTEPVMYNMGSGSYVKIGEFTATAGNSEVWVKGFKLANVPPFIDLRVKGINLSKPFMTTLDSSPTQNLSIMDLRLKPNEKRIFEILGQPGMEGSFQMKVTDVYAYQRVNRIAKTVKVGGNLPFTLNSVIVRP